MGHEPPTAEGRPHAVRGSQRPARVRLGEARELGLDAKHLKSQITSVNRESIANLINEIEHQKQLLSKTESQTPEEMYIEDLLAFIEDYVKVYGDDRPGK